MSETLSHKVYEDSDGVVYIHTYHDRLWLHAELHNYFSHKLLRKGWEIIDTLEDNLKSRGVERYYTAVVTEDQSRLARNYGFLYTNEILDINGFQLDIMSKDL